MKGLIERTELLEHSMPVREFMRNNPDLHVVSVNQIRKAPAVDAEPVRHGEWKEASGCRIICNNCGHYPLYDYFGRLKLSPYCWFCGVKMGGDKVGEGN